MRTARTAAPAAGLKRAGLRIKSGLNAGGQTTANHSRVVLFVYPASTAADGPAAHAVRPR